MFLALREPKAEQCVGIRSRLAGSGHASCWHESVDNYGPENMRKEPAGRISNVFSIAGAEGGAMRGYQK